MTIQERIRHAGVVGAGGAGFPTHVKAGARVDTVIANGAECEPLIHKDHELMLHYAPEIVRGLELLMESTGAQQGILGVKAKNEAAIAALSSQIRDDRIRLHLLGDFYPSGDEYILVYESTGRLIPPQGIPLQVGVVVDNVETLYNVAQAVEGTPVTRKFITVAGAVRKPSTFPVPVGMSYRDVIEEAGGSPAPAYAVFSGGIMMGKLESNLNLPVTKTCAGLIVLPEHHMLVERRGLPEETMHRIGKSACDQCSYCTELCPRYILGYDVQPHKVMRSLGFTKTGEDFWNQYAALCCSCGLCTLYACPENLFPKEACDRSKQFMKTTGVHWNGRQEVATHPMYEGRRTPLRQLIKKLGIGDYDRPAGLKLQIRDPRSIALPLAQHVGEPARPTVGVGTRVRKGDCVAETPTGALGSRIHASIDGVVRQINQSIVIEEA